MQSLVSWSFVEFTEGDVRMHDVPKCPKAWNMLNVQVREQNKSLTSAGIKENTTAKSNSYSFNALFLTISFELFV